MTEYRVDSNSIDCQSNTNCTFAIVGQECSGGRCIFPCEKDPDCNYDGTCSSNVCYWSGSSIPPLLQDAKSPPNSSDLTISAEGTKSDGTKTNDDESKLISPLGIAITVIAIL